jgi:SEC-C motif domain protein
MILDGSCHCGLEKDYDDCCGPFIRGESLPATAEQLMRSRYSAFVVQAIDYLVQTHDPKTRSEIDEEGLSDWAEAADWEGLNVVSSEKGGEKDSEGMVEFVAHYSIEGTDQQHHELADFKKRDGRWFFADGKQVNTTVRRGAPKVGRNDPCPCGSGKKYKKCCAK